ncbi:MAG: hypothetical protein P1U62_13130, partial [Alteraurantiacibacter sp. bin_em_oilr2.035]|nr:hypothetical protein [Alteraurantiacibacter sp. bin_em_oilr2.035]
LASNKAGVTVVIVGLDAADGGSRLLFEGEQKRAVRNINPYLTEHEVEVVTASRKPTFTRVAMDYGVYYSKSAGLILSSDEKRRLEEQGIPSKFFKRFLGSTEFINGSERYCLWISDQDLSAALKFEEIKKRVIVVKADRLETSDAAVNKLADRSHQFRERKGDEDRKLFIPIVSSENREYFPAGVTTGDVIPTNKAFYAPEAPLWCLSIIVSQLHLAWIGTICGRLEMRYSYSNTLGWNTFPLPNLTEQNNADLTRCAENILLAREAHFPATIADLYDPEAMPENLRRAHGESGVTKDKDSAPCRTVISHLLPLICTSTVIALSACTETEPASDTETELAQTYVPPPEYAQQDGDLFMYVGELSEEATEGGERNPVVTFKYLGQEGDQHHLEIMHDNGSLNALMECSNPCRVARQTDAFGSVTRVAV